MGEEIFRKIWELSPKVNDGERYSELVSLTKEIINLYDSQGRLESNPFESSRKRKLSLPHEKIKNILDGRVCLVTGGLGCVGAALIEELLRFNVKKMYILDNKILDHELPFPLNSDKIKLLFCDVTDYQKVADIFELVRPEIVFHTAAQRNPGFAETNIANTVKTNVLGTLNIVKACEKSGAVQQCVFSSTGKSSRYFTEEIYAATKKICENILEAYSQNGRVKYSMVRFTHIVDNSLMDDQLKSSAEKDSHVRVHSPGKFVTAQNVKEAAYLMLNALVYSEPGKSNFLIVKNLEWPVESLEIALYYIKIFKRDIPIVFIGNPKGYIEKFFRGQLDWSRARDLNLLINVYENQIRRLNKEEDIIISNICTCSTSILDKVLHEIQNASGEQGTRKALLDGLREIYKDSLSRVDKKDTANILKWGVDPKFLELDKVQISDFRYIVPLMAQSLKGSPQWEEIENLLNKSTLT